MKVNIFILMLFLATTIANAQDKREKIKSLRTAFFTEKLNLSSSDAEKFWPIYNQYDEQIYALRNQERKEVWKIIRTEKENLTEAQAVILLKKVQEHRLKENQLKEAMEKKITEAFSAKMVLLVKKAEFDFHKHLLDFHKE